MALDQQKTILLLVAILLAVIASSIAVLVLLPNGEDTQTGDTVTEGTPADTQLENFNLNVLERSDFKELDQTLIENNSLPVQPPAAIGKANPFL